MYTGPASGVCFCVVVKVKGLKDIDELCLHVIFPEPAEDKGVPQNIRTCNV